MGLSLYKSTDINTEISDSNQFTITFDGRLGGGLVQHIYIHNDDTRYWYDDIEISAVDGAGDNLVNGSKPGFSWKILVSDFTPNEVEWGLVSPGNTATVSTVIGNSTTADIVTYISVWVRVEVPDNQAIQFVTDITLNLEATEHLI